MVHFFGPDGAGKSTQVDILVRNAKAKGIRVKKCWVRSPHTIAFILWKVFVKIGFYRAISNPLGALFKFPAVDRCTALKLLWSFVEFFGVLPIVIRTRILLLMGYKLIAERYILDTITTIAYFVNDINFLRSRIARLLLYFIPSNTVFIFLNSDYETIFRRRVNSLSDKNVNSQGRAYGAIPKGGIEPREFIEFQRKAYKTLARAFNALEINTASSSIEETSRTILKYLRFH